MDVQQLVSEFLASEHGDQATQALAAQGISGDDAQQMLSEATQAAHANAEEQGAGLMGEHAGKSFFAAFAAGLVRGDGFLKSLGEGGEGVLTGRVAESLAARMGIDPATASTVAAAATPYIVSFLKEKFA
ncbi:MULTISPECIES: hypothetical protein [Pandoraea]|jgi:hypothetical protein|uniref:DUF937 domain-containing protein n=2 Tax=Pandoraea TaxID=93217 RepID=A0A378YDW3_9BURK|nr:MULTISPECIES: hypothetical protein [Pandoraea]AHB05937.1 hypothetical protein U875_11610 [Pandoraea pnomenusa 3kgm]AHB77994.1 hypothetical protein X636_23100 [Pandoraea pnomenusa]AIU25537.1 hypothetical protein LV28_02305 [Pandoraea pnomenusa]ANC46670.1 hypothetical protein A6P55_23360 [Pandoraea pnomenusa]MBN9094940.1 hypothetical protein [Pandoraea pnomenusa]